MVDTTKTYDAKTASDDADAKPLINVENVKRRNKAEGRTTRQDDLTDEQGEIIDDANKFAADASEFLGKLGRKGDADQDLIKQARIQFRLGMVLVKEAVEKNSAI